MLDAVLIKFTEKAKIYFLLIFGSKKTSTPCIVLLELPKIDIYFIILAFGIMVDNLLIKFKDCDND
jgi:hypothetical protein